MQLWASRLIEKFRSAARVAIEPNMSLPGVLGVIVFLGANKAYEFNQSDRLMGSGIPIPEIITPVLMGLYAYFSLWIFTRLRVKYLGLVNVKTSYIVSTLLSSTLNSVLIEFTLGPQLNLALSNGARVFFATFLISIMVSQYREWVSRELFKNIELLASIKQQRKLLIQADEDARRDIASLLHDGVQSKLVVSATKLHQISTKAPPALATELKDLLLELEGIRRLDVRAASRSLSPDIQIMGLEQCLKDLAQVYEGTMTTSFDLKGITNTVESKVGLAVYRICEQGLLNALTHGGAKACLVSLWIEETTVHLEIENNGSRLDNRPNPAQGSAVIDAWVSTLDGIWSLANITESDNPAKLAGGTVRLSTKLSLDSQSGL